MLSKYSKNIGVLNFIIVIRHLHYFQAFIEGTVKESRVIIFLPTVLPALRPNQIKNLLTLKRMNTF